MGGKRHRMDRSEFLRDTKGGRREAAKSSVVPVRQSGLRD